jgi:hypothetical protein
MNKTDAKSGLKRVSAREWADGKIRWVKGDILKPGLIW